MRIYQTYTNVIIYEMFAIFFYCMNSDVKTKQNQTQQPSLIIKKLSFGEVTVIEFKCAAVYQISSKLDNLSFRYGDLTIFKMAAVRHLEFSKF